MASEYQSMMEKQDASASLRRTVKALTAAVVVLSVALACAVAVAIFFAVRDNSSGSDAQTIFWTCDDVTPDLCPLSLETGSITMRGLSVRYFSYTSANNSRLPVVAVHGGPAGGHLYMEPIKQLACRGHRVVFYDQAGCGESDRPASPVNKTAPWLLTVDYYLDELGTLIRHLNFTQYHLIGNSWGTIVLQEFAATQPEGLASMVLSGPLSDAQLYAKTQRELLFPLLPPFLEKYLLKAEEEKSYDTDTYVAVSDYLSGLWTDRLMPLPECVSKSWETSNDEIYVQMQGASEFTVGGVLEYYNFTGRLHEISTPTMLIRGEHDTMTQPVVDAICSQLQNCVEKVTQARSAHVAMVDDAGAFNNKVANFFDAVEANATASSASSVSRV